MWNSTPMYCANLPINRISVKETVLRFMKVLALTLIFCCTVSSVPIFALTVDDLNLIAAAGHGDNRIFKLMLARGANPNALDDGNNTAILMAAYHSKREMVRQLIELHSDVNLLGSIGFTPIGVAAMRGDTEIVRMLLD